MKVKHIDPFFKKVILKKLNHFAGQSDDLSVPKRLNEIFHLFSFVIEEASSGNQISFSSLFGRLTFIINTYKITGDQLFALHHFRYSVEKKQFNSIPQIEYIPLGIYCISSLCNIVFNIKSSYPFQNLDRFKSSNQKLSFLASQRVIIIEWNQDEELLVVLPENEAHIRKYISLTKLGSKSSFIHTLAKITQYHSLPIIANLIDVKIESEETFSPAAIVLIPDFLLDVTAISSTYQHDGVSLPSYLLRKFIPVDQSPHLILGNVSNYFLDKLIFEPKLEFNDVVKDIFKLHPIALSSFEDQELKELIQQSKTHFEHLKIIVNDTFNQLGINKKHVYVEPSFLSNQYGVQGRLDLLHINKSDNRVDIIELKSGSAFKPNAAGISQSHYIQCLLYDMMVRETLGTTTKSNNYILYSKLSTNNLRYAPPSKKQHYQILNLRNQLLYLEILLQNADVESLDIMEGFNPDKVSNKYSFIKRDANAIYKASKNLDDLERAYINYSIRFISQEYKFAKIGEHGWDQSNGLAGLWLDSEEEKIDQFRILNFLEIFKNNADHNNPNITLKFSPNSTRFSKFRIGEIVILYPRAERKKSILENQLFKGTIVELDDQFVQIRLRSIQTNLSFFENHQYWNLESDFLDGSVNKLYKNLFYFIRAPKEKRNLILGREKPALPNYQEVYNNQELSAEQHTIINQAICAHDYYLVWGPPGTGKTSIVIKHLVKYYFEQTEDHILLLAYTNRAVDEICSAITSISKNIHKDFIRIGSRHSCSPTYVENLLSKKIEKIHTRKELQLLIHSKRIFVATVASIAGSMHLLKQKKFNTCIIDEASQILEPNIVGLLPLFEKFILIGDHKQLPAVVTQSEYLTTIDNSALNNVGIVDMKNAFFDRLYKKATKEKWSHAIGHLSNQGRMHEKIMEFVSRHFYNNSLKMLNKGLNLKNLPFKEFENNNLSEILSREVILFIDTPREEELNRKINTFEAHVVSKILKNLLNLYHINTLKITPDTIGIITPFRAQIAQISNTLQGDKIIHTHNIDTVERYQGSARDHIIISLCSNSQKTMQLFCSTHEDKINRKLNVALTRARKQVIVIGNKEILIKSDPIFAQLINESYQLNYQELNTLTKNEA